jgi:transcriptional regulator with XRE-family HTH domain
LARLRVERGVTQQQLAQAAGLPVSRIRELESGRESNPRIRWLMNCALALDVPFDALLEPEWQEWTTFDTRAAEPPDHSKLLRPGYFHRRRRSPTGEGQV